MKNTSIFLLAFATFSSASTLRHSHLHVPRTSSSLTCGRKGWAKTDSIFDADAWPTFSGCMAYCEDTPGCHSFALTYDPVDANGDANCLSFSVAVAGNTTADASSPWTFYDLGCPQPNQECGLTGYSRNDSYLGVATTDVASCAAKCLGQDYRCASYAFGDGQCLLYEEILADNLIQDSSSPYTFYDTHCPTPGASSSTSSTLTTTTTAKSTNTPASVKTTTTTTKPITTASSKTTSTTSKLTTTTTKSTTTVSSTTKAPTSTTKTTTNTTKAASSSTSSTQAVCQSH